MRALLPTITMTAVFAVAGCGGGSTLYEVDASGHMHKITSNRAEIFKHTIIRYADIEAKGVRPPALSHTWREWWMTVGAHWPGWQEFGTHEQVMAFIAGQRRARGLPPL
jgi:hypothetical protein